MFFKLAIILFLPVLQAKIFPELPTYKEMQERDTMIGHGHFYKMTKIARQSKWKGWGECQNELGTYIQKHSVWKDLNPFERMDRMLKISQAVLVEKRIDMANRYCKFELSESLAKTLLGGQNIQRELQGFLYYQNEGSPSTIKQAEGRDFIRHRFNNVLSPSFTETTLFNTLVKDLSKLRLFYFEINRRYLLHVIQKEFKTHGLFKLQKKIVRFGHISQTSFDQRILEKFTLVFHKALKTYIDGHLKTKTFITRNNVSKNDYYDMNRSQINHLCLKSLKRFERDVYAGRPLFEGKMRKDFVERMSRPYESYKSSRRQNPFLLHHGITGDFLKCIIGRESPKHFVPEVLDGQYCSKRPQSASLGVGQVLPRTFRAFYKGNNLISINERYNNIGLISEEDGANNDKVERLRETLLDDILYQIEGMISHLNWWAKLKDTSTSPIKAAEKRKTKILEMPYNLYNHVISTYNPHRSYRIKHRSCMNCLKRNRDDEKRCFGHFYHWQDLYTWCNKYDPNREKHSRCIRYFKDLPPGKVF